MYFVQGTTLSAVPVYPSVSSHQEDHQRGSVQNGLHAWWAICGVAEQV